MKLRCFWEHLSVLHQTHCSLHYEHTCAHCTAHAVRLSNVNQWLPETSAQIRDYYLCSMNLCVFIQCFLFIKKHK